MTLQHYIFINVNIQFFVINNIILATTKESMLQRIIGTCTSNTPQEVQNANKFFIMRFHDCINTSHYRFEYSL